MEVRDPTKLKIVFEAQFDFDQLFEMHGQFVHEKHLALSVRELTSSHNVQAQIKVSSGAGLHVYEIDSGRKGVCPCYGVTKKHANFVEILFRKFDLSTFSSRRFQFHFDQQGTCILSGEEILGLAKTQVTKDLIDTDFLKN